MAGLYSNEFNKLMENEEFVKNVILAKDAEEVQKLYADNGVELTMDEIAEIGRVLNSLDNDGELDAASLEGVSGGSLTAAAIAWGVTKVVIGAGAAGLSIYKWYKSR